MTNFAMVGIIAVTLAFFIVVAIAIMIVQAVGTFVLENREFTLTTVALVVFGTILAAWWYKR